MQYLKDIYTKFDIGCKGLRLWRHYSHLMNIIQLGSEYLSNYTAPTLANSLKT